MERSQSLALPTSTHLYYALSRAFLRGSSSRPPIPIELVIEIFDYAGLAKLSHTTSLPVRADITVHGAFAPIPFGPTYTQTICFQTKPLSASFITKIRQMRLHTSPSNGGIPLTSFQNAEQKVWFEIGILRALSARHPYAFTPVFRPGASIPLRWDSRQNSVTGKHDPSGAIFGIDHEFWNYIRKGDSITIYACVFRKEGMSYVGTGYLEFWEKFDPTALM